MQLSKTQMASFVSCLVYFLFRNWHRRSFWHTLIYEKRAKSTGKKAGQGFVNKKNSVSNIWVSFEPKKKKNNQNRHITCFTTILLKKNKKIFSNNMKFTIKTTSKKKK